MHRPIEWFIMRRFGCGDGPAPRELSAHADHVHLYVSDCDAVYKRALQAGATSIAEPLDQPYGDRSGAVRDAFGNQWYIATHVKDVG